MQKIISVKQNSALFMKMMAVSYIKTRAVEENTSHNGGRTQVSSFTSTHCECVCTKSTFLWNIHINCRLNVMILMTNPQKNRCPEDSSFLIERTNIAIALCPVVSIQVMQIFLSSKLMNFQHWPGLLTFFDEQQSWLHSSVMA